MLQAMHEFAPPILEPLDVKQEASLDSQKEPDHPRLGFYVKYSALDFRTEITDSVITQGMVKVVVKLYINFTIHESLMQDAFNCSTLHLPLQLPQSLYV